MGTFLNAAAYLLGQRVVYADKEICVVIPPPKHARNDSIPDNWIWIMRPIGYESFVALSNIKPLPNGQL